MGSAVKIPYLTVEEYLAFEQESPFRHEYVDGQVYAMTAYAMSGASKNHARITNNIATHLNLFLADKQCEPYQVDIKVKAGNSRYYYPDVVVTCEAADERAEDPYLVLNPILLVEVPSPSTQRTDKVEKFNAYQNIAGLLEYVIVFQNQIRVEVYRHQKAGEVWQGEVFTESDQTLIFQSVGLTLSLAAIYQRVIFASKSEGEEGL